MVLSALLFPRGSLTWMRGAWRAGRFTPLASRSTLDELLRVLGYPKFRLGPDEVLYLLQDYLPYAETVPDPSPLDSVPAAPDPDDQKFLDLAVAGGAAYLVTGDGGLRKVVPPAGLEVVGPGELLRR